MSTTVYTEPELLAAVAAGDETAFRELFARWHQQLGRHIAHIIKSPELTEEIVQDVFVKVWQSREALLEVRSFSDYLFIMTRNRAISELRKLLREQEQKKLFEQALAAQGGEPDSALRETGLSLVEEAIATLSPRQQECFTMSRVKNMTYEEIATELGIGRESVKTHISLALAAITRYVKAEMDKTLLLLWLVLSLK